MLDDMSFGLPGNDLRVVRGKKAYGKLEQDRLVLLHLPPRDRVSPSPPK